MRNKLKHIVLIITISSISACSRKASAPQPLPPKITIEEEKVGYAKATVIKYVLDGCSWMLQLEDGNKRLEPVNLSDDFKKENLKVWIKYQPLKNAASICMAGELVTITAIELRKQ